MDKATKAMDKATLRKTFLEQRKALPEEEYRTRNEKLLIAVRAHHELLGPGPVHVFLPIEKFREVNTWPVIRWLWEQGIQTMTSLTDTRNGALSHVWFDASTQLGVNSWGIPEPVNALPSNPSECSVIFVPLVVADELGNRIGYGKGFYDQFLFSLPQGVKKIGLSLLPLLEKPIAVEEHDVKMDMVLSAGRW